MRSVAALVIMLGILGALPATAGSEIGRVKSVAGGAMIARGKTAATPAQVGGLVQAGDVITTGADGRLGIIFIDNTRFAVGPNSRLTLSQFEFNGTTHKGQALTVVDRGSLAVLAGQIAKENKDAMKFRTPVSLLAARGTRFVVEAPSPAPPPQPASP
jgi:hypothetical protein